MNLDPDIKERRARILIVDNDRNDRQLLEGTLTPEGYQLLTANSGEQALDMVVQQPPDLILLDAMMSRMNGYQVAAKIKGNIATKNIPVIMITGHNDHNARMLGLSAGAEDFLTKPVDRAELCMRVRNLLRLKAYGDFCDNYNQVLEGEVASRTAELRASESRFRQMAENISDAFFLISADDGRILYVSPAYETIWGRSCESLYAEPDSWTDAVLPEHRERVMKTLAESAVSGQFDHEYCIKRPDGAERWVRARGYPIRDEAGSLQRMAGVAVDITVRKEAEYRIAYLNRVYAMLSGINTLIVRVRDRDELFREACRVAVEAGGFRMAWIGIVDRRLLKVVPVAWAGLDAEMLNVIKDRCSLSEGVPSGISLTARAIREKRTIISNDVQSDPNIVIRKKHAESGNRSLVFLPLIVANEAVGVLALYAGELEFFHEEEMRLLTELTGDIAFAIDYIDKRERLDYLAFYDTLTGLANRALFHERLEQGVALAHEQHRKLALVLLDIERFKTINDTLGRPAGDALLKELTARMAHTVDAGRLARIDADHFALLVPNVQSGEELARLIEQRIGEVFRSPFRIGDAELRVSAKFGIAVFPGDGADADTLLRNAEAALKNAKTKGERYLFYTQTMNERVAEKLTLENQLRQALDKGEFVLHYQPKINLTTGKVTGAEALIRWNDPRTGLVPPGRFIPLLEEIGLIHEVGRWALRQAIEEYLRWRAAGLAAVRIAVNVSPLQLRNRGFIAEIAQVICIDAHAADGLELEITESLIMEDVGRSIASLQAIRAMGVTIAIDDFGTGFSSLAYLAKLPVDTLKIDRSFVIAMTGGPEGLALVSTIINLAHALKLNVVAEGVETEEQASLLRLLDCDEMQGFLFSKAIPNEIFETKFLAPAPGAITQRMDYLDHRQL